MKIQSTRRSAMPRSRACGRVILVIRPAIVPAVVTRITLPAGGGPRHRGRTGAGRPALFRPVQDVVLVDIAGLPGTERHERDLLCPGVSLEPGEPVYDDPDRVRQGGVLLPVPCRMPGLAVVDPRLVAVETVVDP